mgnify:CR=1 FL=1
MSETRTTEQRLLALEKGLRQTAATEQPIGAGGAFPSSPSTGLVFYRTDLGLLCFFDGTRWLTVHEYALPLTFANGGVGMPIYAAGGNTAYLNTAMGLTAYFTRIACHSNVTAPNSGVAFWSVTVQGINLAAAAATTIIAFDTSADAAGTRTNHSANVAAANALPANNYFVSVLLAKTGAPGNLELTLTVFFRYVVT